MSESEDEEELFTLNRWVSEQGLPEGETHYNLIDPDTGTELGYIDLAWPSGMQEGYSSPVAVFNDDDDEMINVVSQAGFRCFRSIDEFKVYVERDVLARA